MTGNNFNVEGQQCKKLKFFSIQFAKLTLIIAFSWLVLFNSFGQARTKGNHPNIIFFLVDDMGWMDTSQPFGDSVMRLNRIYSTPNMTRLAQEGMLFSRAYVNPVCTPTRTTLLTGMHAVRTRITNWTNTKFDTPTDYPDSVLQTPDWNRNGLSPVSTVHAYTAKPLPQILKEVGYFTIHVGKAHWGSQGTLGADPLNLGFITNVAGSSIGNPQSFYGSENFGNIPGKTTPWAVDGLQEFHGKEIYLTSALTRKAIQMMEYPIQRNQPFFLYLGHYAVHTPIQPDQQFVKRYLEMGLDEKEAAYASMVEGMDQSLGEILNYLESKKISDNTIIIFLSDNGGLSNAGRGGIRNTHNLPLRSGKGSVYEGGIRVPFIVKWPGITKPGTKTSTVVRAEDMFPTLLEMANVKDPFATEARDGTSIKSILMNPQQKHKEDRPVIIHYPHRWTVNEDEGIAWTSGLVLDDWKLVYLMKEKKLELYNLNVDIGEKNNLAGSNPDQLAKLANVLTNELKKRNAQMPTWKIDGKPVAWPNELLGK